MSPHDWISDLKSGISLELSKVVETSLSIMHLLKEKFLKKAIDQNEYIDQSTEIADLTLHRISLVEKKLKSPGRTLLGIFSYALSPFKIAYFEKFDEENRKYKNEIARYRFNIYQANDANLREMVLIELRHMAPRLEEIKMKFPDERKKELINTQLLLDWEEYEKTPPILRKPYLEEFERDIAKGATFTREDPVLKIHDQKLIPESKNLEQAGDSLKQLIRKPEDERWFPLLQTAAIHACFLTAFRLPQSLLNIDASNIQWEWKKKYYSIKAVFSKHFPPTHLEVIRSSQTQQIEKILVTLDGGMDMILYALSPPEEEKIIAPNVLAGELKFSLIFNDKGLPEVRELYSNIKTQV